MTSDEYKRVTSLLRSVFPRLEYLNNDESSAVFYNILNRYTFEDIWKGVKNLVEVERYAPPIATVTQYIEDADRTRRAAVMAMNPVERDEMTVRCTKCNDAGFVWVKYSDGTETARICTCETARANDPWAFFTPEAYEQAHDQQRKRGQNPPISRPGHDSEWWKEQCGDVVSVTPGKRPPARKKVYA